ncbi:MAG: DUF4097 family beta strand repeat-containing protein [Bacteroidota bacterium]
MKKYTAIFHIIFIWGLAASFLFAAEPDKKSQSFTVEKGGMLNVSTDVGSIRIEPWEKNEVYVQAENLDDEEAEGLSMSQSGNKIDVQFRSYDHSSDARFRINVPSQFDIDIETSGGDLVIAGNMTGKIKGHTSGGDIRLESVTGDVEMETAGGDINTKDIMGDLVLKTSGGNIETGWVNGEATLRTAGGSIRVNGVGKNLKASTAGGNITFGEVRGTVDVHTAGGSIKGQKSSGKLTMKTAGGDIELLEGGLSVTAKTAGGNIRMHNITGSADARTAGGDVEVDLIPEGNDRSTLSTAGGRVVLSIPEDAKATIDARIRVEGRWKSRMNDYSIHSDFKASSEEKSEKEHEIRGSYILNGGGQQIDLKTVNSDIEIRRIKK